MKLISVEMKKASSTETDEMIDYNEREDASVPLISNVVNYSELPQNYIRPPTERPRLDEVVFSLESIPVLDVQGLLFESTRPQLIRQIGQACSEYGFFQIINHGIPDVVIRRMLEVAEEFFRMPVEDRMEYYSDDPFSKTRLSTSFNIHKEQVFNWRDYLRHHCYPLEDHVHTWPSKPAHYRVVASMYCREVRAVALRLLEAISESLGLEANFLDKALRKHEQHMAINYYPKCPNPELTFGLPAHSDPNVLTLLLQDEVPGLQVLNNGHWIAVSPIPNSFVINIGDQLQVLSNGRYRSVLHHAVVISSKSRISIPTFYCPSPDAVIAPAPASIDDEHPALFRRSTYDEYSQKFRNGKLQRNSCLQSFSHDSQISEPSTEDIYTEEMGEIAEIGRAESTGEDSTEEKDIYNSEWENIWKAVTGMAAILGVVLAMLLSPAAMFLKIVLLILSMIVELIVLKGYFFHSLGRLLQLNRRSQNGRATVTKIRVYCLGFLALMVILVANAIFLTIILSSEQRKIQVIAPSPDAVIRRSNFWNRKLQGNTCLQSFSLRL